MAKQSTNGITGMQRDISEIRVSIARIEENMKSDFAQTQSQEKRIEKLENETKVQIENMNLRLKKLEEWQWKSIGMITAATTIISLLITYFIK